MAQVCDGHGATITWAVTSGTLGKIVQIGSHRRYRDVIDNTGLTDGDELFCPGKLRRSDEIEIELIADTSLDTSVLLNADPETFTITYPPGEGESNGAQRTFSGFFASISDPSLATSENPRRQATIRPTGAITVTAGS